MIELDEVGASVATVAGGTEVRFGIYLPGITFPKGYRLKVRIIHELDQFVRGIEPIDAWMSWTGGEHDLWQATVPIGPGGAGHFGSTGRYFYRYQLLRGEDTIAFWFADPFGREVGPGTLSAFRVGADEPFAWTDAGHVVRDLDELVVYELNVREFNSDFDGVVDQLDYLWDLGVNVLELMPVTSVKEDVEWGYTPLGYFAPDDRLGGVAGLKRLVDACHAHQIAVIADSVYAHAHPEFAYDQVYRAAGEANPMLGAFAGEFFPDRVGTDFSKPFTIDYFDAVNRHWLDELHLDGFRYDYVPGFYLGDPTGPGYPDLVYRTYQYSKGIDRFRTADGNSRIIQCAEHLPDPQGILARTYSSTAWQNGLLDRSRDMARWGYVDEHIARQLDTAFLGYVDEYVNPANGDRFPVAPFQYIESHDHRRFVNELGVLAEDDLLGQAFGDRRRWAKVQPYVVALYTARGIPMLWQGGELVENWGLPDSGIGRNLYERPLHWEYFYDAPGKAMVRLHRILGSLRRAHRALWARSAFEYVDDPDHRAQGVVAYHRHAPATDGAAADHLVVAINFTDHPAAVWLPFPTAGSWTERIDGTSAVDAAFDGERRQVTVGSNYGAIFGRT